MGGGSAHIEVIDWGAVVGPARDGAEKEKLLEGEFTLEDVALGEAEFAFEVERGEDLAADDDFFDVGSVLGDGVDYRVAEGFFVIVPGAVGEFVWSVLDEAREDVLAWRRDAGVGEAGDDHVNVWLAGVVAVFGVVVGAFHVFDAWGDGDCAAKMRALTGKRLEVGEGVEREIDFARGAAEFVAADTFEEISGEVAGLEK